MTQLQARIQTNKGDININLFSEKAPKTVANFINLSKRGFYNGLSFHRVIDEFMIQGGCPEGSGMGGPGYQFDDELNTELVHNKPGILSMANSGPNTNGSQFFITHVETPWLDGKHTIFGEVVSSVDQHTVGEVVVGDQIIEINIQGDESFIDDVAEQVAFWNDVLDENTN